jgi:hypothetical protein
MNAVASRSRPKPARGFSQGARRYEINRATSVRAGELVSRPVLDIVIHGSPLSRPNENSLGGRENRTTEQVFINSPG